MNYTMEQIFKIKDRYQNGKSNIGLELIRPCLSLCSHYRRGTGFFSSSALITYSSALDYILSDNVKIDILCSPVIQDKCLLKILDENATPAQRSETVQSLVDDIVLTAVGFKKDPDCIDSRSQLLAYLIADGQLEIRFAIPKNFDWPIESDNEQNIYHVKMGYFSFSDGSIVAFDGSFNESGSGHTHHVDRTQVYRSWVKEDKNRLDGVVQDVDIDWNGGNEFISIYSLSKSTMEKIKRLSPLSKPRLDKNSHKPQSKATLNSKWRHQDEALEKFLQVEQGVLNMATGTGKTRTSIKILKELYRRGEIDSVIISTDGNDLLDQWYSEILQVRKSISNNFCIYRHYGTIKESQDFKLNPKEGVLLASRTPIAAVLSDLTSAQAKRTLLIHDEVHGLGSPGNRNNLKGLSNNIRFRLGLSATPEREYDQEGTEFIEKHIGPVFMAFGLKEAIERGILTPFNYYPLKYDLSEEDRQGISKVYKMRAARKAEGKPMSDQELWTELAKVYKTSRAKLPVFEDFIRQNVHLLERCIVFVEEQKYGHEVMEIIHKFRPDFHTYFTGEDSYTLRRFARGELECIITCHRLSQGIDIQSLNTVILFSSARAKLETIQRIGRCLRTNPNNIEKISNIVDFIRNNDDQGKLNSDEERCAWLTKLSKVRQKE